MIESGIGLPGLAVFSNVGPSLARWLTQRTILSTLQRVEREINEAFIRSALAGYRHLQDAVTAQSAESRCSELLLARQRFAELCELDPSRRLPRRSFWIFTTNTLSAVALICAGHHGSFCCFGLQGEPRLALRYLYQCAVLFPRETLRFFPDTESFFSSDFAAELERLIAKRDLAWEQFHRVNSFHNPTDPYSETDKAFAEIRIVEDAMADLLREVRNEANTRLTSLSADLDQATQGLARLRQLLELS